MADTLPDAPWATGGAALPDAPWVTAPAQETTQSIFGTPLPKRPDSYEDTLASFDAAATERIKSGYDAVAGAEENRHKSLLGTVTQPFKTVGGLYDMGMGVLQGSWAPATAAIRHYGTAAQEHYTGIPAEDVETALTAGGPKIARGAASPLALPRAPAAAPSVDLAAATAPGRGSALSLPGTLSRPGPVDMEAFERSLVEPVERGAATSRAAVEGAPAEGAPAAAEAPAATPRENLGVSLLPPETPHAPPQGGYRRSVGAAGATTDPLAGYSPEAVTKARETLAENGLDNPHVLEQRLEEQSAHHTFGEMAPGIESKMGGIAAADTGNARNTIVQSLGQRGREAPQRMAAAFDRAFGEPQNRVELQRSIEAERTRTASPFWRTFTRTEVPPTDDIRRLMPRLDAAGALKAANKAMREEGLPAQQGFGRTVMDANGELAHDVEQVPTAAAFQYAKEHLDKLIEESLAAPGGAKAARRYTQLKNDLVNAIDRHPDPSVAGVWRAARQAWQEPTELLEAQNLGRRLLTNHIDREDVPFLTQGWSPARMENLNIGLRSYLEGLERSNRSAARVGNKLMDAVLAPGNQDKIRAVLGDERAEELIRAIEHEETMHHAPNRVFGNSATASRQTAKQEWMVPEGSLGGATVGQLYHAVRHPVVTGAKVAAKAAGKNYIAKQEARLAALRDAMARMFTTQGEEKNAIARALIGSTEPPPTGWSRPSPQVPPPGPAATPRTAAPPTQPGVSAARVAETGSRFVPATHEARPAPARAPAPVAASRTPEALKRASAVRLADSLGLTPRIQHMALAGKTDKEIEQAIGAKLPEDAIRAVREHLGYRVPFDEIPFARGGAVAMRTRTASHYSPTRGKPDHHCGPNGRWPEGSCAHYMKPNKCRLVAGFIAAKGGCDWFEKARTERAAGGRVEVANIHKAPSIAQKEAGNYAKDHIRIHGLDLTIENAKGTARSGVGRDGKSWSVAMPAHYGYIKRTEGADGDHVDVYLGPHTKSRKVFVVDQRDAESKEFDEHKCMMGFGTEQQARAAYCKGFSDGKGAARLGHMRAMSIEEFKDWLKYGDTKKPAKDA